MKFEKAPVNIFSCQQNNIRISESFGRGTETAELIWLLWVAIWKWHDQRYKFPLHFVRTIVIVPDTDKLVSANHLFCHNTGSHFIQRIIHLKNIIVFARVATKSFDSSVLWLESHLQRKTEPVNSLCKNICWFFAVVLSRPELVVYYTTIFNQLAEEKRERVNEERRKGGKQIQILFCRRY